MYKHNIKKLVLTIEKKAKKFEWHIKKTFAVLVFLAMASCGFCNNGI